MCWFFCIHVSYVSCLEPLVFLWRRRVYGGSWQKISPFRRSPTRLSCHFAHFGSQLQKGHQTLTIHSTLYTHHTPHSKPLTFYTTPPTLHTSHPTLHTLQFLQTSHSSLYTPHASLYSQHSTLHIPLLTPHSLYTLHTSVHFTLSTPHFTHCRLVTGEVCTSADSSIPRAQARYPAAH